MKVFLLCFLITLLFSLIALSQSNPNDILWDNQFGSNGLNKTVRVLVYSSYGTFVGGDFDSADGVSVNHIAKWDGTSWLALGVGTNGPVYAISVNGYNHEVFIGGDFDSAGGMRANNIAMWDNSSQSWSTFSSGTDGPVYAIVSGYHAFYVGGAFDSAGGIRVNNIAKWDGWSQNWSTFSSGTDGPVYAIASGYNAFYVGGAFDSAGGIRVNNIAKWDGWSQNWSTLGVGINGPVYTISNSYPFIYVGGSFNLAGSVSANNIARWNGSSWSGLSGGANGNIYTINVYYGNVYVGGVFSKGGNININNVAKLVDTTWFPLGSGTNNVVRTSVVIDNDLYIGGQFDSCGRKPSRYMGKWRNLHQHYTSGYNIYDYPPDTTIKAHHKDVIGSWFIAPATGTIDTIYVMVNDTVGAKDSIVWLRIHKSNIGPNYGPGIGEYTSAPPPQSWGYYKTTNDADNGMGAFIDDLSPTEDTTWYSTIEGGGSTLPLTRPSFGNELFGQGSGLGALLQPNVISTIDIKLTGMAPFVTKGDVFFISLRINSANAHVPNDTIPTEITASHFNVPSPSQSWLFFEHDSAITPITKKGWNAIGGVNYNIWYSMSFTGQPQIELNPDSIDFQDIYIGYPETDTLIISNNGDAPLNIISIIPSDAVFKINTSFPFWIPISGEKRILVTFDPADTVKYNDTLTIASNDTLYPIKILKLNGHGIYPPSIFIDPDSINITLVNTDTATQTMKISNQGRGDLTFNISASSFINPDQIFRAIQKEETKSLFVTSSKQISYPSIYYKNFAKDEKDLRVSKIPLSKGGPDNFGYRWIDSDESGGPSYNWIDISSSGTQVYGLVDDNYVGPFPIGFQFNYYGNDYTEFYISSNGFIGFGPPSEYGNNSNQPIPYSGSPNNILSWCWDDLYPNYFSNVYYKNEANQVIVQFENYGEYGANGWINAEVILNSKGNIIFQYKNLLYGFDTDECTIGIENNDGTDGLEVVFNQDYLHENLAILFFATPWVTFFPPAGTVLPGDSINVSAEFDAQYLFAGTYYSQININSNDPEKPIILIPLKLDIKGLTVEQGWNLISIPLIVDDFKVSAIFPTAITNAFYYDGSYQMVDTFQNGLGYWLKFPTRKSIFLTGTELLQDTINVINRWNIIGSLSYPISTPQIIPINPVSIISNYYGYRYGIGYFKVDTIKPGYGYWVKVDNPGQIVIGGSFSKLRDHAIIDSIQKFNKLIVEDANGHRQTLNFLKVLDKSEFGNELSYFEMPPIPPENIFDVRFASNRMCEVFEEGITREVPIYISSADYPVTLSWETQPVLGNVSIKIDGRQISMSGRGYIQVVNPESRIVLKYEALSELPKKFSLDQNHPNPFNPSTVVNYQLPVESRVKLTIYNMLGQLISTLVDEIKSAGYKSVDWDASHVASGIYFYRLDAVSTNDPNNSFHQVNKMLLMK